MGEALDFVARYLAMAALIAGFLCSHKSDGVEISLWTMLLFFTATGIIFLI